MAVDNNERLALTLEECSQRVRNGEPMDKCLASYPPEYRDELNQLVPLVGQLHELAHDPSQGFQSRLEKQLGDSVDTARQKHRPGLLTSIGHFFAVSPMMRIAGVAVVVLLIVLGGGFGIVQASERSLPDSPLYQVKTAREWAEQAMAGSGESLVGVQAQQISTRGQELQSAIQANKAGHVVNSVADRLALQVQKMVDKALEMRARGNRAPSIRALVVIRMIDRRLDRLATQASPAVLPSIQRLRSFMDEQERRLLDQGTGARLPRVPGSLTLR
ncbi:MAG: hypothetical protein Q8R28_06180 [Dehalococcoidia bacterium]|nr:hypothetical protein [Dehalococcoidia bacterium]